MGNQSADFQRLCRNSESGEGKGEAGGREGWLGGPDNQVYPSCVGKRRPYESVLEKKNRTSQLVMCLLTAGVARTVSM